MTEGFSEKEGKFLYIDVSSDGSIFKAREYDSQTRKSVEIPMSKVEVKHRLEKGSEKLEAQIKELKGKIEFFKSEIIRKESGLENIKKMLGSLENKK